MLKEQIREMLKEGKAFSEMEQELEAELKQKQKVLNASEMIELMIELDELENEEGSAPDTDFILALAERTGTASADIDRFWKYCAYGNMEADWED